eukprot:gnl/MRDRNA2_/MRDRNA2_48595_c0_seq1.p1 gnl/MRDRNA2_/MRDRNA2_48595_c0~~gnl/MRDRNA2_/MRDRNA2_48595_c0_seq1.p1  ORF type:complete len:536 (-),score=110.78 gnl/MRDRNA2_/MRDRNA2_48595_c0_seq1:313-1920(-)
MCASDSRGTKRPPALPKRASNLHTGTAAALEGDDIQALLDRCDHIQEQWDHEKSINRKAPAHKSSRNSGDGGTGTNVIDSTAASLSDKTGDVEVTIGSIDNDLLVVDLVTEEGKEWEDALLEMRRALDEAKALSVQEAQSTSEVSQQFTSCSSVSVYEPNHTSGDSPTLDSHRQKFQTKLRELALGSNDDKCELSGKELLEAARLCILQDELPIKETTRSTNTLRRSSSEVQLTRTPSLDNAPGSQPSTSRCPFSGRASATSLSVESVNGYPTAAVCSSRPSRPQSSSSRTSSVPLECSTKTPKSQRNAALHQRLGQSNALENVEKQTGLPDQQRAAEEKDALQKKLRHQQSSQKGDELQRRAAHNVTARCKAERASRAMEDDEREAQQAKRIIQSDMCKAQREASEKRVQSEKAQRASALQEVMSTVKDAQRKRQEESFQKATKLQQRCATQEWEDCAPQVSARRQRGSRSVCGPALSTSSQDHSRSAPDLGKLPRLHASRSPPPAPAKQAGGEGASVSLPQIPRTRSWIVGAS